MSSNEASCAITRSWRRVEVWFKNCLRVHLYTLAILSSTIISQILRYCDRLDQPNIVKAPLYTADENAKKKVLLNAGKQDEEL